MTAVPLAEETQEVLGQKRDVVAPFAQGRHAQGNHIESVVKILPETALPDCAAQILVGGRHQAQVHLGRSPAQPFDLALLQNAQQAEHGWGFPDLVEEEVPPSACRNRPS